MPMYDNFITAVNRNPGFYNWITVDVGGELNGSDGPVITEHTVSLVQELMQRYEIPLHRVVSATQVSCRGTWLPPVDWFNGVIARLQ